MQTIEAIRSAAIDVRQEFDRRAVSRSILGDLYVQHNPHVTSIEGFDINIFLDYAEAIFPQSNCGIASIYLKHVLGQGQVTEGQYLTECHQFLQIGKTVVDITADQFGGPPVYVGPLELPWNLREY